MGTFQGKWVWYELMTTDAAAAKAFYEAVVGWSIAPGTQPPIFYGHIARPDGREIGGVLPLTPEILAHGARPCWVGYIAVDDLAATLAAVLAAGGRQISERMDIPEGSFAMVADPQGAPFYLMRPTPGEGTLPSVAFDPGSLGSCGWNELAAADAETALSFYTALFGWSLPDPMDMGEHGFYHFIAHGGTQIGAAYNKMPQDPMPHWNHYFEVSSIKTAAAAIADNGGKVVMGPLEVPGGQWIVLATDPQGAFFCLVAANGD